MPNHAPISSLPSIYQNLSNAEIARLSNIAKQATKEAALEGLKLWQKQFQRRRRSPKKQQEELYMLDTSGQRVSTVSDFIKQAKKKKNKNQYVDIGALNTKHKNSIISRENKRATRQANLNAMSGSKLSTQQVKAEKTTDWMNIVLQRKRTEYVKNPASIGEAPYTWKNSDKGIAGKSKSAFPDYYMLKMLKVKQLNEYAWRLSLSPQFQSEQGKSIFKALEYGGNVESTSKRLEGYALNYYTIIGNSGKQYGKKRRKITPIVSIKKHNSYIGKRPFLSPVAKEVESKKLTLIRKLLR